MAGSELDVRLASRLENDPMNGTAGKMAAVFIVAAEIMSLGASTTASAQSATYQRKIDQQQRMIIQQQKQILRNQRLLESQQQQIASRRAESAGAADSSSGSAGNVFDCPPHYYHSFVRGCLPDLRYLR